MAQVQHTQGTTIRKPKVVFYGTFVGLVITAFWITAPVLVTTGHAGWLLVTTAVYSLLLIYGVARAQAESEKLQAMRNLLIAMPKQSPTDHKETR